MIKYHLQIVNYFTIIVVEVMDMTLDELKKKFQNGNRFEIETGMSHVNWANWFRRGYVPIESQRKLERITKGKLIASLDDLPKEEAHLND